VNVALDRKASKVDCATLAPAVEQMLPEIRDHVAAIAACGPRQTGQYGCERALDYVHVVMREIGPHWAFREFTAPVTVALDRTDACQLRTAAEGFSHVVVDGLPGGEETWPGYALLPNSAQACATHAATNCPWQVSAPGDECGSRGRSPSMEDVDGLSGTGGRAASRAACRACEIPRRIVDLRSGSWEDLEGRNPDGAVVLLDFNSGDAWLRAAELGAVGALFIEPDATTVFQADRKYLATLPLHFPRLLLRRDDGLRLRAALQSGTNTELRATLGSRLAFRNVPARGLQWTIPGRDRSICFVLTANVDARCIAPDLSYGAAEAWGVAELLALARFYAAHPPAYDLEILFVSGHWQQQQLMRDELAPGSPRHERLGRYYRLAMGIDLEPEGTGVNLMTENAWDTDGVPYYGWIGRQVFRPHGLRDQVFAGFRLPRNQVELYAGIRPTRAETVEDGMGNRSVRSPLLYTPRYCTPEEAWMSVGTPAFAFQSCRLARLQHLTPLDRFAQPPGPEVDAALRPQLQVTLGVLQGMLNCPAELIPRCRPFLRERGGGWGGYAQVTGRVLLWDRNLGWFATRLPGQSATGGVATARGEAGMQTFVQAIPANRGIRKAIGPRLRNYLQWPQAPDRGQHRELQSFMFQDLRLLEGPDFCLRGMYACTPEATYDVVGYAVDAAGRLRYATDYGIHGDGNRAFQCTDRSVDAWNLPVPVSLFACGSVELLGLVDPQRYNPNAEVFGAWYQISGNNAVDRGMPPFLRVSGVKDVQSHTDLEHYGFTQYGRSAMVFLPSDPTGGAEILLGSYFNNFTVLNRRSGGSGGPALPLAHGSAATEACKGRAGPPDPPSSAGLRLAAGESVRFAGTNSLTLRACPEALAALDRQRMREFAVHDVASPVARRYADESSAALAAARSAQAGGRWKEAFGQYQRAWNTESEVYRRVISLLIDVVSTTVLYFVMLLPFSLLVERLLFPQRTVFRSALVCLAVFTTSAAVLYQFHPGFRLAHNVIVTTTAFTIVVMTIPALFLLLLRGVAMLQAIGSKAVITQQSEAESAGVVTAALSLAVSNMRRRRLRTSLTLGTITLLVVALVLLTTSAAFDFTLLEPSWGVEASFEGVQVYNARDHRQPLLKEMVEQYEGVLDAAPPAGGAKPLVVRREYINYGFDPQNANGALQLAAGARRVPVPYFQVMDWRDNLVPYFSPLAADARAANTAGSHRLVHLADLVRGEFLAPGDVDVCLLPNNLAADLGVTVGDTVTLMGLPLQVKGIWAANEPLPGTKDLIPGPLDRLADLDGLPLTAMDSAKAREGEPDVPLHASSSRMAILPRAWVEKTAIFPTCVYSLIVIPGATNDVRVAAPDVPGATVGPRLRRGPEHIAQFARELRDVAGRLSREILNVDVYTHHLDAAGRHCAERLAMRTSTRVQGSSMMAVVLVVAVLMILAIMTGTVYERMREIHIFSSVGLSPRHVAGIFLVEALVYAGIAAVLGYFIGIVALKALLGCLKASGSAQEFYPNYLGVFVLYATGVAVLATLASSIYPIRLASRIVNPAGSGPTWEFEPIVAPSELCVHEGRARPPDAPQPRGGSGGPALPGPDAAEETALLVRLPFIATTWEEAQGMMVYAAEWMGMHQGERSGRFVCERPPAGHVQGRTIRLAVPVWLAPFERNLTQETELCCVPAPDGAWWTLALKLRRVSGPPYLWRRGATVFVNLLSRHLLRWRAATEEQEAQCRAKFAGVFAPEGAGENRPPIARMSAD
jgi:hypothetical protein